MRFIAFITLTLALISCVSPPPLGTWVLTNTKTGSAASGDQSRIIRAECLIEKNKITLPIPREEERQKTSSTGGLGSFMAGASAVSNARQREEDREALAQAKAERSEVYEVCLLKGGLTEIWVPSPQL